jgi:hypothetical protein
MPLVSATRHVQRAHRRLKPMSLTGRLGSLNASSLHAPRRGAKPSRGEGTLDGTMRQRHEVTFAKSIRSMLR